MVAFRDAIDAHVHLGAAGHPNSNFLAQEEVRVAPQGLRAVYGVMVRYGDDGHAHPLQPVIDFRGIVVGLPADASQPGNGEHSGCDRVNVKVAAHGAIVACGYEQPVKRSRNLRERPWNSLNTSGLLTYSH